MKEFTTFKYPITNVSEWNPYTTRVFMNETKTIAASGFDRWLYVEGNGIIDQIFIDSNVNDYTIEIKIDDTILFNTAKAQSWFATYDDHLHYVSAYTSGSAYILSLRDIYFKESFHIQFKATTAATFTVALCRYTVQHEAIRK